MWMDFRPLAAEKARGRQRTTLELFALATFVLSAVFRSRAPMGVLLQPCFGCSSVRLLLQKEADALLPQQEGWSRPGRDLLLCRSEKGGKGSVLALPPCGMSSFAADVMVVCAGGGGSSSGTQMACPLCDFSGRKGAAGLRAHWRQKHRHIHGEYDDFEMAEEEVDESLPSCDSELVARCEEIVGVGLDAYGDMKYTAFDRQATLQRAKDAGRKVRFRKCATIATCSCCCCCCCCCCCILLTPNPQPISTTSYHQPLTTTSNPLSNPQPLTSQTLTSLTPNLKP